MGRPRGLWGDGKFGKCPETHVGRAPMWIRIRDELCGKYCKAGERPESWDADKAAADDIKDYADDIEMRGGLDAWGLNLDSRGWVPGMAAPSLLHVAASNGRALSVRALVHGGATQGLRDPNGLTPIEIARARRDAPCVRALGGTPDWGEEDEPPKAGGHAFSEMPAAIDGIYQAPPPGWRRHTAQGAAARMGPITPAYSRSLDIYGI